MDHKMRHLLNILNESENMEIEEKSPIKEAIEQLELFEDNNMSRSEMAIRLTINDEDVDLIFEILSKNKDAKSTLNEIDTEISFNGIDEIENEKNGDMYHFLRNGDIYKDTIVYYNGKYFVGSIGSLMESEFDLNRMSRIK